MAETTRTRESSKLERRDRILSLRRGPEPNQAALPSVHPMLKGTAETFSPTLGLTTNTSDENSPFGEGDNSKRCVAEVMHGMVHTSRPGIDDVGKCLDRAFNDRVERDLLRRLRETASLP